MEVWTISYFDIGTETAEVESVWSDEGGAINYLRARGATEIQDEWLWSYKDGQGGCWELSLTHHLMDKPGWMK